VERDSIVLKTVVAVEGDPALPEWLGVDADSETPGLWWIAEVPESMAAEAVAAELQGQHVALGALEGERVVVAKHEGAAHLAWPLSGGMDAPRLIQEAAQSMREQVAVWIVAEALSYLAEAPKDQGARQGWVLMPHRLWVTRDLNTQVVAPGIERLLRGDAAPTPRSEASRWYYASPEQTRGDEPTAKSDVFALGVVLHEWLLGRRPFEAPTPYAAALKTRMARLGPWGEEAESLSNGLLEIMVAMLAKDPEARMGAKQAAERLRGEVHDEPAVRAEIEAALGEAFNDDFETEEHRSGEVLERRVDLDGVDVAVDPDLGEGADTELDADITLGQEAKTRVYEGVGSAGKAALVDGELGEELATELYGVGEDAGGALGVEGPTALFTSARGGDTEVLRTPVQGLGTETRVANSSVPSPTEDWQTWLFARAWRIPVLVGGIAALVLWVLSQLL